MSDEDQRSDPDAVELDSFHRRHAHQPLRPTSRDKSAANVRSNGRGDQAALAGGASQNGKARLQPAPSLLKTHPSHSTSRRSSESRSISTSAAPRPIFNQRATCSSTPPHDGSEASSDPEIDEAPTRPRALGSIDTASAQDASLPSPSLSPITAAAHVGRSNSASRLRGAAPPNLGELGHRKESSDHGVSHVHPRSDREKSALLSPELMDAERKAPTPAIKDIPHLLNTFDYMPENMQQYIMYQLLRRSSKTTLHFVAEAIAPALKVDFFKRLPPELRENIVGCLDVQSMCRAAQVSKLWRHVIDRDEKAWMRLISANNLNVPNGEVGRAIKEGWGWQFPRPNREWEFDLTKTRRMRNGTASALDRRGSHLNPVDLDAVDQIGTKRKRAAPSKPSESNKRLRRHDRPIGYEAAESINDSAHGRGPNAYAKLAEATIPDPRIGVKGLRQMALHKSIYRRHHRMRASWLDPEAKPKHIAFRAHEGHVITCLQFDSEKILTGSDDAIIDIYDTATGAQRRRLTGHEGGVWALEYQDNILVSGSTDRSVRIWDMNNGKCLHIFQGHTSTVRCLQILQPTEAGRRADGSPIMLPRERLIITGSRDSSCRIWKLPKPNDRSVYQTNPAAAEDNPFFQRALTGHTHSVRAIAAHSDVLVSGSYDNTVKVWQISTGDTMHTLRGHSTKVYSVVLDHERKRCISGSMDTIVKVWSIETGECLFNLNGHSSLVGLLDLKDNVLVSAAADWTLKIWDPEHGRNIHTLKAHSSAITCFAHDGYKVVSGSEKTLKMWSTQTGLEVRDLLTDLRGVWQVRFDERRCIAAVHRGDWTYIEVSFEALLLMQDSIANTRIAGT